MARLLRRTALAASSARHRRSGDDEPAVGADIAHRAEPIDRAPRREDVALASLDPAEKEKQTITA